MGIFGCQKSEETAEQDTDKYDQAVADFYMSLGASETDQTRFAFNKMNDVALAFPEETSAWANLAVFAMRQGNFTLANERIGQALELNPDHPEVLHLAGLIASRQGNIAEAIEYFRQAAPSGDPRVLYALAQELERENPTGNADEIKKTLQQLLEINENNQVVLLELARIAIREQNAEAATQYLTNLEGLSDSWNPLNREQLGILFELLEEQNFSDLSLELSFLRSGLESQPRFQDDLLTVQLPPTNVGFLITEFIHLNQPEVQAAEPDLEMQLTRHSLDLPTEQAVWVKGVTLLDDAPPFPIVVADGQILIDGQTQLDFPGSTDSKLSINVVTEIDYDYDFRNDLAAAGSTGFKLFRLNDDRTFSDITSGLGLSNSVVNGSYTGVWAFDVEMDGDLDLLLSASNNSFVLRNNGDGTFTRITPFNENQGIEQFLWADLDGEGTPEAIILTSAGSLIVYKNLRGGSFDDGNQLAQNIAAIAVGDMDANAQFEIIAATQSGSLFSHNYSLETGEWQSGSFIQNGIPSLDLKATSLFTADLDNNGSIDLILSTNDATHVWLGDENRNPVKLKGSLPGRIYSVFDVEGDEKLDLLGIADDLSPFYLKAETTKEYFARSIRAQASGSTGDQRINSFGIGGEMEVRSGLLYQKQLISSPIVHFGLGEYEEAQMLRIIWPNGSVQAEFAELGMGSTIFNEQILKGSCPWLFTHDGEKMQFITDILWRSPLGLRINAQETAGVVQTLDRVKIPAEMLVAENGIYSLRITAELWESHFFDHVQLVAVDHPVGTEIFVDERFVFPAPDLSTKLIGALQPVQKVTDQKGNDLTNEITNIDQDYIQPFEKTKYQGLAKEHFIEITLQNENVGKQELLVLHGWLRPTDSSINLALSQGSIEAPKGLKVEFLSDAGNWKTLYENFGIPAGKTKTLLLDLEGVLENQEDRKIRLTTTSEIYWDGIFQAEKMDSGKIIETELESVKMELQYRGFSEWSRADSTSPMLPDYNEISSTTQRWRDLEGFHTRFGDVSELLEKVDDRYVIMNAGDEIELQFKEGNPPQEGYQRSFVFVSDGWEKDGDYNTEASATVLPLPYHGQADYEYGGGGLLWEDPVYQKHKEDWVNYHTRYITPAAFRSALLFGEEE
ncbi:FG-GAP-like repeat-containing protein [Rhodohalobacter sp. 614A]|uniref:FG-GAP-like repeat-containing protein n=1 Tax=Rhodohalobacter sp. 614A TaxID=2908649 RepID=UPI001F44BDD2|nr:FG-GAP-like repeat-containing protein [Rhodohalobacter sp. 614A]